MSNRAHLLTVQGSEPQERDLPDRVLPYYPVKVPQRELRGLNVQVKPVGDPELSDRDGPVDYGVRFLGWLIGRQAYCTVEHRGYFDLLLKWLPYDNLRDLAEFGETEYGGSYGKITIRLQGQSIASSLSIRAGNEYGRLYNIYHLIGVQSAEKIEAFVSQFHEVMNAEGFGNLLLKPPGQMAQEATFMRVKHQQRLPEHVEEAFFQSFKGARMEGVYFGASSDVYDYDMRSSFPSKIEELPSTNGLRWETGEELPSEESVYAAVLADVVISSRLVRSPVAVRDGAGLYFPVGNLQRVWLGKPEVELLRRNPSLGRISHVYLSVAGYADSGEPIYPFRRMMKQLFQVREKYPVTAGFALKHAMVSLWGKFISVYRALDKKENAWIYQASPLFNPAYAAHVTSLVRCELFKRSFGNQPVGEFVDGVALQRPLTDTGSGLGSMKLEGHGDFYLFTDQYKSSVWKSPEILDQARSQKDKSYLEIYRPFYHTIASARHYHGTEAKLYVGKEKDATIHLALGSGIRDMGDRPLRVGDFLTDRVPSWPLEFGQLKFFKAMRKASQEEESFVFA